MVILGKINEKPEALLNSSERRKTEATGQRADGRTENVHVVLTCFPNEEPECCHTCGPFSL